MDAILLILIINLVASLFLFVFFGISREGKNDKMTVFSGIYFLLVFIITLIFVIVNTVNQQNIYTENREAAYNEISESYGLNISREQFNSFKYKGGIPEEKTYYGPVTLNTGPNPEDISSIMMMVDEKGDIVLLEKNDDGFTQVEPKK